jgi:20S proteasome alpha/beta subunit
MAIGFQCHEGLVLGSDSVESDGYRRRIVDKEVAMFYMTPQSWGVSMVGAGEILDKFFKDAIKEVQKCDGRYDIKEIEQAIEKTLRIYRRRFRGQPLRVIVGVFNENRRERHLFRSDESALTPIYDYAEVGLGGNLWEFLASNFHDEDMSCDECVALAAFILKVSAEFTDRVGGPIRVVKYEIGDGFWRHPTQREITALLRKAPLSDFEALLRRYWRMRHPFKRWNDPRLAPQKSEPGQ